MNDYDAEEFVLYLTGKIREQILPHFGKQDARLISGKSIGGDSTFLIDDISETFLARYLEEKKIDIAYYSEDKGFNKLEENIA